MWVWTCRCGVNNQVWKQVAQSLSAVVSRPWGLTMVNLPGPVEVGSDGDVDIEF